MLELIERIQFKGSKYLYNVGGTPTAWMGSYLTPNMKLMDMLE